MVPGKASHRLVKILILRNYISTKNNYTNINTNILNCLRSRRILGRDPKLDLVAIHAPRLPFSGNSSISCAKRLMMLAFGSTCFAAPLAQDEMIAHGFPRPAPRVAMMRWWADRLDAFKSDVERRPILSQPLFTLAKGG
jgi:hypothetical protein